MPFPKNQPVIDLMMGIPHRENRSDWYNFLKPLLMDQESRDMFEFPVEYMYKDIPQTGAQDDYVAYVLAKMDAFNIRKSMIALDVDIRNKYPDRFLMTWEVNPNRGMEEVRAIRKAHQEQRLHAVSCFPSGLTPQVPVNDKKMYPIYALCCELGLPFLCCVGVPGPRVPMEPQRVEYIDEVCWFFPELVFIMRHGAVPWQRLAVSLMLKYPNLYYSTSAFAPKYYPQEIIDYANTRGGDKIMYAGYFPMGLTLERIFAELSELPLKDEVWPKFLHDNAARVFKLQE